MLYSSLFHFVFLSLVILFSELLPFDFFVQEVFFFPENKQWLVPDLHPVLWPLLYQIPKILMMAFGGVLIIGLILSFFKRFNFLVKWRQDSLQIILSLALVPLVVGKLKYFTHMHCPKQLTMFGGDWPYVGLFESLPMGVPAGQCFPAGHASAGFALLALAYTDFFKEQGRWKGLFIGLTFGWVMGLFKMARGDHFLSHTLVSQELAFLFNIFFAWLLQKIFKQSSQSSL